jgi:hypothetical protein
MATSPATAPAIEPKTLGLPLKYQLISIHVSPAAAVDVLITTKAFVADAPAVRALPALKPNHPNQRRAVPRTTWGMLLGSMAIEP